MTDTEIDQTHDVKVGSWVSSANRPTCDFPLQNLPIGMFRREEAGESYRAGIAIGDQILDLNAAGAAGVLGRTSYEAIRDCSSLNQLAALGRPAWHALRAEVFALLKAGSDAAAELRERVSCCLVGQDVAGYSLPTVIGDYTDFYTSSYHASNIAKLIKPDQPPLTPNFMHLPVAYHGRASSVGVSGQKVWRPMGQYLAGGAEPIFGPCQRLDFELELGFAIGPGNQRGASIPLKDAEQHILGLCLLNDWSARDIQFWESVPLGPFLAKNFATTVSPWLVSLDALAPYRVASRTRSEVDPKPLPYLTSPENTSSGGIDIQVRATIQTAKMRSAGSPGEKVAQTSFAHQYWTIAQMLTHHTVGGCQLRPGDLIGTGTISGPGEGEAGALIELSRNGTAPLHFTNGEQRNFLEDGDAVVLSAWCERPGFARIGFGESRGIVIQANG